MSWTAWMNSHPAFRVSGSDGPYVLVENHIAAPVSASVYDARTDMMVWSRSGDFHNAALAHDEVGNVIVFRTGNNANDPVPTGLKVEMPGKPVETPLEGFETEVLGQLDKIVAKLGA